jgi:hypothetical protein
VPIVFPLPAFLQVELLSVGRIASTRTTFPVLCFYTYDKTLNFFRHPFEVFYLFSEALVQPFKKCFNSFHIFCYLSFLVVQGFFCCSPFFVVNVNVLNIAILRAVEAYALDEYAALFKLLVGSGYEMPHFING